MATISFTTRFDYSLTPKRITFVDTSDYAGQGIATSSVNGSFRIIAPSGSTIYNNTDYSNSLCDIDVATSVNSQQTISFVPELGLYTIIYTVYDTNTASYYTVTNTYDNTYVQPTISIEQTANCISQIWTQEDITDYVVNGITPTKTLVNKLYYPAGSAGYGTPITKTVATLRTTTFYNGTQSSEITATLTYAFTDGLTVYDIITGVKEKKVDCAYYCSILCCIKNYERLKESYRGNNPIKFNEYNNTFKEIMGYVSLIRLAIECGNGTSTDITWYLETIRALSNCTSECDCSGEDFSRVTGWGSVIGVDGTDGTDGADGADGTDGTDGVSVLNNNITVDSVYSGAFATLKSYTIPANTLTQDGDALQLLCEIVATGTGSTQAAKVLIGGVDAMPTLSTAGYVAFWSGLAQSTILATITRKSSTTVYIEYRVLQGTGSPLYQLVIGNVFYEASVTVNNLTTNTNVLDIQGKATATDTIVCKQLMVTYLKKS